MTAQTTPAPGDAERPAWQRYLPAGAAATVAVAALIGIQAASSDGSSANQVSPQGGPPGMTGQGQGQGPSQSQNPQQPPPWGQDGAGGPPAGAVPPGVPGAQGQATPDTQSQQQAPDAWQGLPSARSTVS